MLETGWSKIKVLASGEGCYCSLLLRQRLDATSFREEPCVVGKKAKFSMSTPFQRAPNPTYKAEPDDSASSKDHTLEHCCFGD